MKKRESKSPSRSTKRALTSSVLALVLCFVMLLGTTFAWFTDTASTKVNTIQAGTLDVALLDESDNSLEGKTLKFIQANDENETVAVDSVLWEPGCTYNLQTVKVKNNGNLALKYKVVVSGIEGDEKLNEVIEWTIKGGEHTYTTDSWISLGKDEVDTLTISGHMKEEAGNTYQGLSIEGVAISVVATQDTVEYDSYTNQYDENAVAELNKNTVKVINYGDDVNNITLKSAVVDSTRSWNNLGEENGYSANGHNAIVFNQKTGDAATFEDCIFLCDVGNVYSVEKGSLTFTDCTFYGWVHFGGPTGATIKFENCTFTSTCDVKIGGNASSVTFDNCTFEAKDTIVDSATMNAKYTYAGECGRVMIWSNTTFSNCTILREVYEGVEAEATYTDCVTVTAIDESVSNENYQVNGNAAYINTTFDGETVYLNNLFGEAMYFVGCTFDAKFGDTNQAVVNGKATFIDCTFNAGFHINDATGANITIENCDFSGTSYFKVGGGAASVVVKDCTFAANSTGANSNPWGRDWLISYSDITFDNCTLGRQIRAGASITITLKNCVNGSGVKLTNNENNSVVHDNASPTVKFE